MLALHLSGVQKWTQVNNNERAGCHSAVPKFTSKSVQLGGLTLNLVSKCAKFAQNNEEKQQISTSSININTDNILKSPILSKTMIYLLDV